MGWSGAPDFVVKLKITIFWILDFPDDAACLALGFEELVQIGPQKGIEVRDFI